jgi:hypothetical protein
MRLRPASGVALNEDQMTPFSDMAPRSLVEVDRTFARANCLHHLDDKWAAWEKSYGGTWISRTSWNLVLFIALLGGSMHLWNVAILSRDYTTLQSKKLSYSPLWEHETWRLVSLQPNFKSSHWLETGNRSRGYFDALKPETAVHRSRVHPCGV